MRQSSHPLVNDRDNLTTHRDRVGGIYPAKHLSGPMHENLTKSPTLSASVGDIGQNDRNDVAKIEKMLGAAGDLDLKQTDGPTGYWGMRMSDATKAFQKKNKLKVDGQINPLGPTLKKLGEVATASNRQAQTKKNSPRNSPVIPGDAEQTPAATRDPATQLRALGLRRRRDDENGGLTTDAMSANARAARYLASRRGVGDYPKFVADGIEMNPNQGIPEAADLIQQTRAKSPEQADELFKKTLDGLSETNAARLRQALRTQPEADAEALSLDARVEREFGLEPNINRPQGLLPMPERATSDDGQPGDIDWTSWTAPEWVYESARAVALPKHVLDGGQWSEADVTRAALTTTTGGSLTSAPRDALRSGFTRLRGSPKYMRKADIEKQGRNAAEKAMQEQTSVPQAMFREDVGEITFDFGNSKYGLEHIRSERMRKDGYSKDQADAFVAERVPQILAHGKAGQIYGPPNARRVDIRFKDGRVTLSLRRAKGQETWILTGYEDW